MKSMGYKMLSKSSDDCLIYCDAKTFSRRMKHNASDCTTITSNDVHMIKFKDLHVHSYFKKQMISQT